MKKEHVTKKEIEHIAWLAHIELSEKEKSLFAGQFNEILDYFKKIEEANTDKVEPTYHVLGLLNVFREDTATPSLTSELALENAPRKEKKFFRAPRIV